MNQRLMKHLVSTAIALAIALHALAAFASGGAEGRAIREINDVASAAAGTVAIVGARLIDGLGGEPLEDATVVLSGERIVAVGSRASVDIPTGAEIVEGAGLSILPGLIDAHFHRSGGTDLPALFLSRGVTSVRDPGAWIEAYDEIRQSVNPIPRLFLTGPHLDNFPPAHRGAFIVQDADEARIAVNRFIDQGASAIKVYYRLTLGLIRVVTSTAEARGVPVVAHLEIVDARDAIAAGLSGIEHVTDMHVRAHQNMIDFVGMCHRGGVRVVVGSHSSVPYAERGWAYHREMELLVASGMTPLEVISAATIQNARFFRVQERLGSVEVGKLADLLLVEGNPALDITKMRQVKRVMSGGRWVTRTDEASSPSR